MGVDVSVIVTTWNSSRWIASCVRSLLSQEGVQTELTLVDNGSTDQTLEIMHREAPHARLIRLHANRGPAYARNRAIQQAVGRYVLTLDHDVELAPGFLEAMVEGADRSPRQAGMWTGTILRPDRRTIDSTGMVLTKTWRAFDRGSGAQRLSPGEAHEAILGPSACAALYRRAMLEELQDGSGYFDERFFFLWEDIELAWRAVQRGWQAVYVPEAVCYHVRNGSSLSPRARQALSFRNRYLFLAKHRLWRPLSRYLWCCGLYDLARLGVVILTNPLALRSAGDAWRGGKPAPTLDES